jgi:hypothetical protein
MDIAPHRQEIRNGDLRARGGIRLEQSKPGVRLDVEVNLRDP